MPKKKISFTYGRLFINNLMGVQVTKCPPHLDHTLSIHFLESELLSQIVCNI